MTPTQASSWWHWPYRNIVHPAFRLPQSPAAQPHDVPVQFGEQMPPPPQPQSPQTTLQSK
jgi:hypothetical protein